MDILNSTPMSTLQVIGSNPYCYTFSELEVAEAWSCIDLPTVNCRKPNFLVEFFQEDEKFVGAIIEESYHTLPNKKFAKDRKVLGTITYDKVKKALIDDGVATTLKKVSNMRDYGAIQTFKNIMVVVANYIKNEKPYAYDAILKSGLAKVSISYLGLDSWINICNGHLDELEKALKYNEKLVVSMFNQTDWEELLRVTRPSNIPASVKSWIDTLSFCETSITALMSSISELEDGNNAVIMMDYLKAVIKYQLDRRNTGNVHRFERLVDRIKALIEIPKEVADYNSKDLVAYLIRQNYYNSEVSAPFDEMQNLYDYLEMARNNNLAFEKYPNNVYRAHNCMMHNIESLTASEEIQNAFLAQVSNWSKYEIAVGDYVILTPKTAADLTNEGNKLRHCVGNYIYNIARGESIIGFLRKATEPETPFVTIEIEGDRVVQAKTAFNNDVSPEIAEVIKKVEKKWKGIV